jgi:hypothetical protein
MAKFRAIYSIHKGVTNEIEFNGTKEELEKVLDDHCWDSDDDDLPYEVLDSESEQIEAYLEEVEEIDDDTSA